MKRVVCIGNPFIPGDDLGSRVYQQLAMEPLPDGLEIIDGGLAGLNLLRCFDHCRRLVFVDALHPDGPDSIYVWQYFESGVHSGFHPMQNTASATLFHADADSAPCAHYGHSAGLGYLLQAARAVRGAEPGPDIYLIGAHGDAPDSLIPTIAGLSLRVARDLRIGR